MHEDLEFPSEKVNTSMLYLGQGQIEPESYTSNAEEEEAWQAAEERMNIIGQNGATGEHYGEPMDDNCPAAHIGELGNQVHNLGCAYQNDEYLSDELGKVAVMLWDLAEDEIYTAAHLKWDGTGMPSVGTECGAVWLEMPDGGDWDFELVIIKGYWENQVWFCTADGEDFTQLADSVDFYPILKKDYIISEAPDLYEALEVILADYWEASEGFDRESKTYANTVISQSRAALAKARGET